MASIVPEYDEFESDSLEEVREEEQTSATWILNEETKTIGAISDDKKECVIQSLKCALMTEQQEHEIYPIDYGSRLNEMIGDTKPQVYAEIECAVAECLEFDDRVNSVDSFSFSDHGDNVVVNFCVDIDGEEVEMSEEVVVSG